MSGQNTSASIFQPGDRALWMALLAKAPLPLLERRVSALGPLPTYRFLRSPEIGLTMVRGRIEGEGKPFNLGEMTLTRCVVQLEDEGNPAIAGFGYVAGRCHRHAELAAVCDALLQHPGWAKRVTDEVVLPLQTAAKVRRDDLNAQVEATRVNFFTLKRGES